jgi:hypothetical protein
VILEKFIGQLSNVFFNTLIPLHKCIKYQKCESGGILISYSNVDYGDDINTCCSTSSYYFILVKGVVVWASKKQCAIIISSTKSEYMTLSKVATKAIWLKKLLEDLGFV